MTEIWGHRGAYDFAPENTLKSFQMAADMGADGIELDIQLTRDSEIVVIHDEKIDRTSNGQGYVKDFALNELKKLNFNKRGLTAPLFMELPTLSEVLELLRPTKLPINIELKTSIIYYEGIEEKALKLVETYNMADWIIWSSFNHLSIQKVRHINPTAETALLCGGGVLCTGEECKLLGVQALHCGIHQMRYPGLIEDCHKRGVKIRAYTVNTQDDLRFALKNNIDGVFTNNIKAAKEELKRHGL